MSLEGEKWFKEEKKGSPWNLDEFLLVLATFLIRHGFEYLERQRRGNRRIDSMRKIRGCPGSKEVEFKLLVIKRNICGPGARLPMEAHIPCVSIR